MTRSFWTALIVVISVTVTALPCRAAVMRKGDQLKIKLAAALNAASAHTGDTVSVSVPDGFKADPNGQAEIPKGTTGLATFTLIEKSPTGLKYTFSSIAFLIKSKRVEIKTAFGADDATSGALPIQKASPIKKLLLPPLLGFLLWKDSAVLPAGRELQIVVSEGTSW